MAVPWLQWGQLQEKAEEVNDCWKLLMFVLPTALSCPFHQVSQVLVQVVPSLCPFPFALQDVDYVNLTEVNFS